MLRSYINQIQTMDDGTLCMLVTPYPRTAVSFKSNPRIRPQVVLSARRYVEYRIKLWRPLNRDELDSIEI